MRVRTAQATVKRPEAVVRRSHNRLSSVLDEAARVFAEKGFSAASIRQIVDPIGMLPGSLYYHFTTKDELLVAVYEEGVKRISAGFDEAVRMVSDPWDRLEAASAAHLTALLDGTYYSRVVIRIQPGDAPDVADRLVALRDSYEARFAALIADLPLRNMARRSEVRLLVMGAMNWTQTWFRKNGRSTPAQIAKSFIGLLKSGLEPSSPERI